jgi:hypothetical protein
MSGLWLRTYAMIVFLSFLVACASSHDSKNAPSALGSMQKVASNETAPAGDIPDTQAWVVYHGPGYQVVYPDGWARSSRGGAEQFALGYDGEEVQVKGAAEMLREQSAIRGLVSKHTALPAGDATIYVFTSDSAQNPVTGKRVRLENNAYVFTHGPRTVTLVLWAPVGSDNVDQWRHIASSFQWVN